MLKVMQSLWMVGGGRKVTRMSEGVVMSMVVTRIVDDFGKEGGVGMDFDVWRDGVVVGGGC